MRNYRLVNLVILGFLAWALIFPLVSPSMERIMPGIWRCQYRALTGNPCPFCGLTGDMRRFLNGEGHQQECSLFPLLLTAWLVEVPVRLLFTVLSFRTTAKKLPVWDTAIHSAGLALLLHASNNGVLLSLLL